ncbi:hypothetical protein V3C99_008302, partial [Haemonchus contortus]
MCSVNLVSGSTYPELVPISPGASSDDTEFCDGQTNKQTNRQTDKQTNRQTDTPNLWFIYSKDSGTCPAPRGRGSAELICALLILCQAPPIPNLSRSLQALLQMIPNFVTDKQTNRQTDKQTNRQTDKQTHQTCGLYTVR